MWSIAINFNGDNKYEQQLENALRTTMEQNKWGQRKKIVDGLH